MRTSYKTPGIVLRRYPLGEADTIVHLITPELGKVEAVAKGARRIKSRLLAVTQPFVYGEYLLFPGRSLDKMSQGAIITAYRRLREDLDYFAICSYCAELVDRLLPVAEPAPGVFALLKELFDYLHSAPKSELSLANALALFRIILVQRIGYQIDFTRCLYCGRTADLEFFSIKQGGPLCKSCSGQDETALSVRPAVCQALAKLPSLGWPKLGILKLETYLPEIEKLLDDFYLYHLEIEPRSTEFLYSLRS